MENRWGGHMSIKKWVVSPIDKERASQIAERWGIPFFLAMMLQEQIQRLIVLAAA